MTDTQPTTLTPDQPAIVAARHETAAEAAARVGVAPPGRWAGGLGLAVAALAILALLAVGVASVLPSGWFATAENRRLGVLQHAPYARTPASAEAVDDLIAFSGLGEVAERYPPVGDFYLVTVMSPKQSLLSWLVGRDEPAIEFVTHETVFGFQSPSQRRRLDQAMRHTSEQVAQYVALQRLGYDVSIELGEVLIEDIVCLAPATDEADDDGCARWSPSDAVIDPGDKILEVDGSPVATTDDLSAVLEGKQPGDVIPMRIDRPDVGELDVEVELTASPDDEQRTIIGFYPFDTRTVELPFELDVDINAEAFGGPSAGLAFTLTLIDELTAGELTGGRRVAVTGTIQLDGKVGPIGGLVQKASAVAQTGVDVFLVPSSQGDDDIAAARRAGGDGLEFVPVGTLEEALAALERIGGDGIPAAPDPGA